MNHLRHLGITCKICALVMAGVNHINAGQKEIIEEIREAAIREVRAGNIPGVSIALIQDGEVFYAGGFGLADKTKKIPAEGDTFYRVASISKLFNALAIMHASDAGKLSIDL